VHVCRLVGAGVQVSTCLLLPEALLDTCTFFLSWLHPMHLLGLKDACF